MAIAVLCPICGRKITGPDKFAGKVVRCPACRSEMQIPETVPTESPSHVQSHVELLPIDVDLVEVPNEQKAGAADGNRGGIGLGILLGLGAMVVVLVAGVVVLLVYLHYRGDGTAKHSPEAKAALKKPSLRDTKGRADKDKIVFTPNEEEKLMLRKLTATEDEAKQALKKALDSWVLGDSYGAFKKQNPEILVHDTSWSIRDFVLLRYEVIAVRKQEKRIFSPSNKQFTVPKYEIAVLQSFRSNAGTEIKDTRTYRVEKSLEYWLIMIKLDSPELP